MLVQYKLDTFDQFIAEYATNLSAGGIFIRTDDPREVGTMLYLQFFLKDGKKLIEGLGRVVHSIPPGTGDKVAGMGIEFVSLDEESQRLIDSVISTQLKSDKPEE
jgi:type IV pilus assembly protein PilZ